MRIFCIAFILALSHSGIQAASSDSLFLIPQPKKIEIRNNTYNFSNPYSVSVVNTSQFYLQQLEDAITKKFRTSPTSPINKVKLIKADSADFDNILQTEKLAPPFALGAEGYIISISHESILVVANENAGIFCAVQTLIQLINANSTGNTIPCMVIYDKPDMQMRGWQDDISRGPIPTMDFLKEEIRRMASFKLNTFTLYTEHVFKLRKHPDIAPADGITEQEIKELTAFAKNYHVDIIGNFQSFGHFKKILQVPGYEHLGENEHTLSPAKEKSYKFLGEVYSEIAPAYDSKYFHINCDEVSFGTGPSEKMIDSIGVDGVYAYHINRIESLLKPYNKRIMMWGDIAVKNPKIIDRLPKDMIIVSWGYSEMERFDEDILPFVKSGFEFIVAPGVNCWNRIYPDMERSSINIYNYLRDGYKNKALGFINTTWDDDGQNLFNNNWYSLIWGAECGWNAPVDTPVKESEVIRKSRVASFNRAYNKVYYDTDKDITSLLKRISDLKYGSVKNCLSNGSLWIALLPDYNPIPENYGRNNFNLIKTLDSLNAEANELRPFFRNKESEFALLSLALRQAKLVVNKNLLGILLKNYIQSDSVIDINYFEKYFAALSDTIKELKAAYGKLWALENRNWWLDTVYSYYDSFAATLNNLKGVCIIKASHKLINGKREIRLHSAFNNLPVYYTTDGTIPTVNSIRYTYPIYTDSNIHIRARVIEDLIPNLPKKIPRNNQDGQNMLPSNGTNLPKTLRQVQGDSIRLSLSKQVSVSGNKHLLKEGRNYRMYDVASDSLIFHKGIGKPYKLNSRWNFDNSSYEASSEPGLSDGRRGSKNNFSDGRWHAYLREDIEIELDFGEAIPISKVSMGFAQLMRYGILYPRQIEVSTSRDGNNYTLIKTEVNTIDPNTEERSTHDYIIQLKGINTRYIKIVAKNTGVLPEWHYAKGKAGWLFADEIMVE